MARRRRTAARGATAAFAVLIVTAGPGPLSVPAGAETTAAATAGADTVFQSGRYVPRGDRVYSAGPSGYLHAQEGRSGYLWTSYGTGTTTELGELPRAEFAAYLGSSSDTVTDVVSSTSKVVLRDMAAGTSTDVTLTHGAYWATYGRHVLTQARDAAGNRGLWLYGDGAPAEGTTVDGWPTGITSNFVALGGDADTAVISYALGGQRHLALVDLAAAKVTGDVIVSTAPTAVALSADRLVWSATLTTAHVLDRADLSAAETTVTLPGTEGTPYLGIAGRWLVVARSVPSSSGSGTSGQRLMAVPLAGGDPAVLLPHASTSLTPTPDGGLLVAGGADSGHWAVRKVADTGADAPTLTEVTAVPAVAARIDHLSLQNGNLATDEANSSFMGAYYTRRISTTGTSYSPGPSTWQTWDGRGAGPYATGSGLAVTFSDSPDPSIGSYVQSIDADPAGFFMPSASGSVLDITGRYVIVNGTSPARQYVGDLGVNTDPNPILTRSVTAASVWGSRLWTPGTANGVVTARDLKTGRTTDTVSTGAPCVAKELQTVGRWVYWSCGPTASAGVWDRTTKKNIPVPSGEALLGDGYLVRHDTSAGVLLLTDFADGSAATRQIGELAAGNSSLRGASWTVDKFGGPAAYVDAANRIHLVPSGVVPQPLGIVESEATDNKHDGDGETNPWWQWRGLLSRPASSWKATITSKATGALIRTFTGGEADSAPTVRWNLRDTAGVMVPNGAYTFTLTAPPADGSGATLTMSRTVNISTAAPVRHDYINNSWEPDGIGDVVGLKPSGVISYIPGNGKGAFGTTMSASGWPSTVTLVPFGDLNGDRDNDILVRFGSGELRAYRTGHAQTFTTSTARTSFGTGWNQYNVLTYPGDITGDGRPDLIARKASTGEVFLYKGTSGNRLAARVRIAADWSAYKRIVGVGDFNGDGRGDLLAQDKSNTLWRFDGTGTGGFKARVKVAANWGSNYNAVIGVGDITGDARADIVSRDTAGNVWRNSGNGKGSFGPRTRIATGWQTYKGLY
ncbi:FG-GAP-like repeat-containing protein [Streptomyces turgidiscabies]|uniref:FG-GAP repeat protein n=1 Tax=Streptomyces turgidiscabies (strain Car8) TaxID=698760 RepID=L7FAW8_STRT8|nr:MULTISPECIES: FG-GAP-like repeat-containing protein [Streptomyces]ELP68274.1 FG-GAP repeat protein [Streptomyces turgidiscabies Car8]MDX3492715.1 FG-GAP-like repeat-containing protein [Streptomyces turgidiscabies]GAQ75690.1 FG-GAP repeat protein [Streptomyces turgidiscabies]